MAVAVLAYRDGLSRAFFIITITSEVSPMSTHSWYPFYPGDYARDTQHLTMLEHGAYRILLDHYYATGKPLLYSNAIANAEQSHRSAMLLPDNSRLYRICGVSNKAEQDAVDNILEMFFTWTDNGYVNDKALKTIEKQKASHEKRMKAGKAGAKARYSRQDTENKGKSSNASSNAIANAEQSHSNRIATRTRTKYKTPLPPKGESDRGFNPSDHGRFSVEHFLDDNSRQRAKENAPGWDVHFLMRIYDEGVNSGDRERPRQPAAAFPAWCARYTKGKKP